MKKIVLTAFAVSLSVVAYAQSGKVGINTPTPSETLDVNGTERVRTLPQNGVSNAIYTKPDGTTSPNKDQTFTATKALVADDNGVIGSVSWLPAQSPTIMAGVNQTDAVTTTGTASSVSGSTGTTGVLATRTFILSTKSIVTFSFNLSVSSIRSFNSNLLSDGAAKRIGAKLLLNSATLINSGIPFTSSKNTYADGYYYLFGTRTLILPAGTHTVDLYGTVFAYNTDNIGISAAFGASPDDQVDIIATPIQ